MAFVLLGFAAAPTLAQSASITSITPNQTVIGQTPAKITIRGTGFVADSVVLFNDTQVTAKIKTSGKKIVVKNPPAELFASGGRLAVKIVLPNGTETNAVDFLVGSQNTIQVLEPTAFVLNVGESTTISAIVTDPSSTVIASAPLGFTSVNPDRASVDSRGVVTALAAGAATIRLSSGDIARDVTFTISDIAAIPSGIVGDGDIKVDSNNIVYATDLRNHVVKSAPIGKPLVELAGATGVPGNTDGTFAVSRFNGPLGLGLGKNQIFLADTANRSIRSFNRSSGEVETVLTTVDIQAAGGPTAWGPRGVVQTSDGTLYITDAENHVVWQVTLGTQKTVKILAGSSGQPDLVDGTGNAARFNAPQDLVLGATPNTLVVADRGNKVVRVVTIPDGNVATIGFINRNEARQTGGSGGDNQGNSVGLSDPTGVDVGPAGNIFVTDGTSVKIIVVDDDEIFVEELAQVGTFDQAISVAVSEGTAYILDSGKQEVLQVALGGPPTVASVEFKTVNGEGVVGIVTGTNFLPESRVRFNEHRISQVNVENSTRLTFLIPPDVLDQLPSLETYELEVLHRGGIGEKDTPFDAGRLFDIEVEPNERTVVSGQTTDYRVSIRRRNFTDQVKLSVGGLPSGATAKFTPDPSGNSTTLAVSTTANTPTGRYALVVTGTAQGVKSAEERITLNVTGAQTGLVAIEATPGTQTVAVGQNTTYRLSLLRAGFTGDVTVSVSGLPTGSQAKLNPETTNGEASSLTVLAGPGTAPGTYTLTVSGTAQGATVKSVQVKLIVTPASQTASVLLAANPPTQTVQAGQGANYKITLSRKDFGGEVALSAVGLPPGAVATFSPQRVSGDEAILTISTNTSTPVGTYTVTVGGTADGPRVSSTVVALVVTTGAAGAQVKMSATPSSQTVSAGREATYSIALLRNNFTGLVQFSVNEPAPGIEATFDPDRTTGNGTTLTVRAKDNVPSGTYVLVVRGAAQGATIEPISVTLVVTAPTPSSVTLSATPASRTVAPGQVGAFTVFLTRTNFTGEIKLSVSGLPAGASAEFNPERVTGSSSSLSVSTGAATPAGTYPLTISGSGPINLTVKSTQVTLVVVVGQSPRIVVSASPQSQSVQAGQSATYSITLARTNFTGEVDLSVSGLPGGVNASFNPDKTTGNTSVLTVQTTSSTTAGTYTLSIGGTASGATVTAASASLTVGGGGTAGVTLSASPTSKTIQAGQGTTYAITLNRTNFAGEVRLGFGGLPSGASASLNPDRTTGTTSTLTVSTTNAVVAGTYTLTITGTATGTTVAPTTVTLTVTSAAAASATLSASPTNQTVSQGGNASYNISINRTNFGGEIKFGVTGLPNGVTAGFNPDRTTGNGTVLTVSASNSATPGTYTLTVSGLATGALVSPVNLTLIVNATAPAGVALTATPATQTVRQGQGASFNIALARTNFTGPVSLAVSGLPTGITGQITPNPTTGNSATLNLTVGNTASLGTRTVTIAGTTQTSGVTVMATTVTLNIIAP